MKFLRAIIFIFGLLKIILTILAIVGLVAFIIYFFEHFAEIFNITDYIK